MLEWQRDDPGGQCQARGARGRHAQKHEWRWESAFSVYVVVRHPAAVEAELLGGLEQLQPPRVHLWRSDLIDESREDAEAKRGTLPVARRVGRLAGGHTWESYIEFPAWVARYAVRASQRSRL